MVFPASQNRFIPVQTNTLINIADFKKKLFADSQMHKAQDGILVLIEILNSADESIGNLSGCQLNLADFGFHDYSKLWLADDQKLGPTLLFIKRDPYSNSQILVKVNHKYGDEFTVKNYIIEDGKPTAFKTETRKNYEIMQMYPNINTQKRKFDDLNRNKTSVTETIATTATKALPWAYIPLEPLNKKSKIELGSAQGVLPEISVVDILQSLSNNPKAPFSNKPLQTELFPRESFFKKEIDEYRLVPKPNLESSSAVSQQSQKIPETAVPITQAEMPKDKIVFNEITQLFKAFIKYDESVEAFCLELEELKNEEYLEQVLDECIITNKEIYTFKDKILHYFVLLKGSRETGSLTLFDIQRNGNIESTTFDVRNGMVSNPSRTSPVAKSDGIEFLYNHLGEWDKTIVRLVPPYLRSLICNYKEDENEINSNATQLNNLSKISPGLIFKVNDQKIALLKQLENDCCAALIVRENQNQFEISSKIINSEGKVLSEQNKIENEKNTSACVKKFTANPYSF